MANGDIVGSSGQTWIAQCIRLLPSVRSLNPGLVDGTGQPMSSFNEANTWGIDYKTCLKFCNGNAIPLSTVFDFQSFAGAFTNYLLPWLALTAQLPYETGSPWSNIMSFCLAVGSPALVTYSLTITILNRFWVRQRYFVLLKKARNPAMRRRYPEYHERIRTVEFLLSEAQQVSLRASQRYGWLSSLIVLPANQDWWIRLKDSLRSTRRTVTFSLVAQVFSAVIAWLFVIISAFRASLGDPSVALQISAGSLWIWLIPVICGWIVVGTQYTDGTITDALSSDVAELAGFQSNQPDGMVAQQQEGIIPTSGLTGRFQLQQSDTGGLSISPQANTLVPDWCGANIEGAERREGPIYNYARIFTHFQFARCLTDAIDTTLNNINSGISVRDQELLDRQAILQRGNNQQNAQDQGDWDESKNPDDNLNGGDVEVARYCNLHSPAISALAAYPEFREAWRDNTFHVFVSMLAAALTAVIVQWSTTGAAVIIAYLTPAKGLGCRSGAYVLYGSLGSAVWLLLLASMLLSHVAMLRYQHLQVTNPSMNFSQDGVLHRGRGIHGGRYTRTLGHSLICGSAVLSRLLGKLLATCNALWIVLISLLEFIGVYDNCWCSGNVLSEGQNGWIMLFKTAEDLKTSAQSSWAGGVTLRHTGFSWVVCVLLVGL